MPRLPEELIERIKREVPLVDLCREYGIQLNGGGKNLLGPCPFHEDGEASFSVTPSKNLWNCLGGCGGGDTIQLVMRQEGVSFRRAAEKLAGRLGLAPEASILTTPAGTHHEILTNPGEGLSDARLMGIVTDFYHQSFLNQPQAMMYLRKRKCFHPEAAKRFRLGFANRTLGYRVPATTAAGKQLKAHLQKLGVLRKSGHEHLSGSVVFPICDRNNVPVQLYGRKLRDDLRKGTPLHLYLEQPKRGLWNREGVEKQKEWLLCESIIDALTLWCQGFRNVTCSFGVNGFGPDHWRLIEETKPDRVVICYDHDRAGNEASASLSQRLGERGIGTLRARLPEGCDINRLAVESKDARAALAAAIEEASVTVALARSVPTAPSMDPQNPETALPEVSGPDPAAQKVETQVEPDAAPVAYSREGDLKCVEDATSGDLQIRLGDRHYRVRGLAKNLAYDVIKVQLKLSFAEAYHLDNNVDLCSHKQREHFIKVGSAETELRPEIIKRDLGRILLKLEELQEQNIRRALKPESAPVPELDKSEREAALALLRDPDLLNRIVVDFAACGVVGEDTNKLVGYLAAVSRKFDKPLGIIVQSTSAAGKTTLMESILAFIPDEERVKYSAMTGQALFYLGETELQHKILAIAEEEGAERASYALKLLQSEGELTIASTGKDATTGRLITEEYHVQGPVMIFLTTTAIEIDEELLNRCLVLSVDESREQTRRIHQLQREAETIEGVFAKEEREALLATHRNAQRLLRPLPVHNHFAPQLTFMDDRTRTRRDQVKYLTLIRAIALLHQYQRPLKSAKRGGRTINYLEVTKEDILMANRLAGDVLGRSLDELPPQTRRFLDLLRARVAALAKDKEMEPRQVHFTQRNARNWTGWTPFQVKKHLAKLVDLEYALAFRNGRGITYVYELLYQGEGEEGKPFVMGLIDPENLHYDPKWEHPNADREPPGSPQVAPGLRGGSDAQMDGSALETKAETDVRDTEPLERTSREVKNAS